MKTLSITSIKAVILFFCCVLSTLVYAQDPSSILDLESTTQGVLIPRMLTSERTAIASPAQGLLVYDTNIKKFYYYDNSIWNELGAGGGATDEISDADGDTQVKTETNPDEDKVRIDIGGQEKMILEQSPGGTILFEHKNNNGDVAFGAGAGDNLQADGTSNTLIGNNAGNDLTTGDDNTFIGANAGGSATGNNNTYIGRRAGLHAADALSSVYIGSDCGFNATGNQNTFLGNLAGGDNNGNNNVLLGFGSGRYSKGSDQLYIENSSADSLNALIYGQFNTNYLRLNAEVRVKNRLQAANGGFLGEDSGGLPSTFGKGVRIYHNTALNKGQMFAYDYGSGASLDFDLQRTGGSLFVHNAMTVGGTDMATGYVLSVNGKIAAEEVLVELKADWPDYVFTPSYQLPSLSEVQHHIDEKGHLIGVPSAKEVEESGIQLGEMNKILLEKIEELTLYILDEAKQRETQQTLINTIEMRIEELGEAINKNRK